MSAPDRASGLDVADLQRQVDAVPFWWHSIDIGHGIVTPGHDTLTQQQAVNETSADALDHLLRMVAGEGGERRRSGSLGAADEEE